jgi:hypothetical protein
MPVKGKTSLILGSCGREGEQKVTQVRSKTANERKGVESIAK